jgi:hypothetical protein
MNAEEIGQAFNKSWDYISTSFLPNLSELPANIESSFQFYYDKLTLSGNLPRADWTSLSPIVPIATIKSKPSLLQRSIQPALNRPYLTLFISSSIIASTFYYYNPIILKRNASPLIPYTPILLLPTTTRPNRASHNGTELRKEAVLILGADGGAGRELALDLESRGFIVICTVRYPVDIDVLERKGRGNIKALVLDDQDVSLFPFPPTMSFPDSG